MKRTALGLTLAVLSAFAPALSASDIESIAQVRATEPTVVEVVGAEPASDAPCAAEEPRPRPAQKRGVPARAWNRALDVAGWSLNNSDVIPSARERRAMQRVRQGENRN